MHDHIRHLARHIAREEFGVLPPRKPLRFSCSNDIKEFMLKLQGGADSCLIRGIRTPKGQNLPDCTNYIKGVGVRLIVVEFPIDLSSLVGLWPMSGDLVWLRLRNFSSINFPDTISLGNLRVLELEGHGDLEQLFQRFNMPPLNLSVLNINVWGTHPSTSSSSRSFDLKGFTASYLFRFLEWIGTSINVPSKIVLKNITSLQSLPIAFRELKNLRHLDLSGCSNLTQMPNSFSELMHLQYLALRDCINLSIPSDILGEMSALEYVDFKGCCKLVYLPMGIANQRSLKYLNLLGTHLKWPLNIELPEKLQRLRIGNLGADRRHVPHHHHHLGNLRPLKELEELILIHFQGAGDILWEEIAWPNMKVVVIRDCPIDSVFGFKEQRTMQVGRVLRDLTLSGTEITEIWIPEGVLPSLEILDLSRNRRLVQVKGLPSTLIRLNLQGCVKLKALINLSNLVNLKFLCINGCGELETLNVEGLMSLEEIQAEQCPKLKSIEGLPSTLIRLNLQGCGKLKALINLSNLVNLKFLCINECIDLETLNVKSLMSLEEIQAESCLELKSIEGLSQPERLKYLRISTSTDVIWNDICNVMTPPFHEKLSTAIFSGKSKIDSQHTEMVMLQMQSIREQFNLKVVDFVFYETREFHTKMEDFQSYGGILMCLLTDSNLSGEIRVRFEASDDVRSAHQYTIRCGYGGQNLKLKLHVFMWTEECNLFRDEKCYNNIAVSCHLRWSSDGTKDRSMMVKRGWIMMVDKNTQVSQVCREIIIALS